MKGSGSGVALRMIRQGSMDGTAGITKEEGVRRRGHDGVPASPVRSAVPDSQGQGPGFRKAYCMWAVMEACTERVGGAMNLCREAR